MRFVLRRLGTLLLVLTALLALPAPAHAQNYSFDARTIGMGGVGGNGNLATKMIDENRDYSVIVLPIGLIQILGNTDVFKPSSSTFDPVRAMEYAANPYHYVIGRSESNSGEALFVSDVRNATLSRKLSKYKGFVPANNLLAEGLMSPNIGHTFKVHKTSGGGFQGIYVGAGPYLSLHSATAIDSGLTNVLLTGVDAANAQFPISEDAQVQLALEVTGGYRGRFPLAGSGSERDGIYLAANYDYLHGFLYDNPNMQVKFLTDSTGSIVDASNIVVTNRKATKGSGFALDFGIGAVINRIEVGFGARGLANRINWTSVEQKTLTLASLTSGNSDFVESTTIAAADTKVELPVDYRGNFAYNADRWAVVAEAGKGFGGNSFHGGVEKKLGNIEVRAGGRYTSKKWNPTVGVGFDFSKHVALDVAAFGTSSNIQLKRQTAIAASIRITHMKK